MINYNESAVASGEAVKPVEMNSRKYLTIVVRYDDESKYEAQKFHHNMEVLGGIVSAVSFSHALDEINALETHIEELEAKLYEAENDLLARKPKAQPVEVGK